MKTQTFAQLHHFSPYQLNDTFQNADTFYQILDLFSEQVVMNGRKHFSDSILQYQNSGSNLKNKFEQGIDVNLLDILILGVLWNEYKGCWSKNIESNSRVLLQLNQMRKTQPRVKNFVDNLRGKLSQQFLDLPKDENTDISLENIRNLGLWLSATNEFNEEVLRIQSWIEYLESIPKYLVMEFLAEVVEFADWFKSQSSKALGKYTEGVKKFLLNHREKYTGKENFFLTGRKEVEYHLNMVGASIMNKDMRKEFIETEHQILLLPTCMTKNKECRSIEIMTGRVCTHCTPDCNVSIVTKEVSEQGIFTFLVSHSSSFSEYLKRWTDQKTIGLIGTACTLNLLMGGFEMKRLNIPAQCVFLDYSGCKKHWTENGIPTSISISRVKEIIGVKACKAV